MTKYGDTTEMQNLAYGGAKATVPAKVITAQNTVTLLINNVLNRKDDYSSPPEAINQVANIVAADMLKFKGDNELTTIQLLDEIKVLLAEYMDQAPTGQTNWGNVRWV